jgi:hypothetical protein
MSDFSSYVIYSIFGLCLSGMISEIRNGDWQNKQDKALQAQSEQMRTLEHKLDQILQAEHVNSAKLDQTEKTQVEQGKLLEMLHGEIHSVFNMCYPPTTEAEADY